MFSVVSISDDDDDKMRDGQPGQEGDGAAADFLQLLHFIFDQFSDFKGETIHCRRSACAL